MAAAMEDASTFPEFYTIKPVDVSNKRGSVRFKITFGKGLDESKKNSLADEEIPSSAVSRTCCTLVLGAFLVVLVIILILVMSVYLVE